MLLAIALKQHCTCDGKRQSKPEFVPAVCSTLGEFGQGMFRLQEVLVKTYASKMRDVMHPANTSLDGYTIPQLTAVFRSDFKAAMQVAVAKGFAKMMLEAGLPHGTQCAYTLQRMLTLEIN